MGSSSSKDSTPPPTPPPSPPPTPPPPPPPPFTSNPWRNISKWNQWNEDLEKSLCNEIKQIKPISRRLKPNLVLMGPVGAGKSSFVNAILSVAKGRKIDRALTASGQKSCTTNFEKYTDNSLLDNFRLRDCMGIEQNAEEGFNVADIVSLLEGHIKDGYQFNPRSPISMKNTDFWRANPELEHQTHCVVFVVDANVMNTAMPAAFVNKIREIQEAVKRLRVPRVLILTKADVRCPEVEKDIKNMFWSIKVREAVKTASEIFNIPEASIHPVTNYEDAIIISWERNIPLLLALRQITQYANDRIVAVTEHSDSD